ncbi:hypothetical protein GUJ93_ZPchr0005g15861 [Zizania palustris]|uniref:Uncharacterized protein n=1 Tax=Zizania palustris TaxID=103762 RepID=A0A8J5SAH3_ZIZPA|nr:hypothetical protein GUJ93_ZPchr0005g15861 [Zizania palustris]
MTEVGVDATTEAQAPFICASAWAATCGMTATEREHASSWVRSLEGTILAMMSTAWDGTLSWCRTDGGWEIPVGPRGAHRTAYGREAEASSRSARGDVAGVAAYGRGRGVNDEYRRAVAHAAQGRSASGHDAQARALRAVGAVYRHDRHDT